MRRLILLPLVALCLALAAQPVQAADDKDSILADELRLKNAFQNTDGPTLLTFLRTRPARIPRAPGAGPGTVPGAAAPRLAARRPTNTAAALLAYLPHAENESVMEEIKAALAGAAYIKGKPDPAVAALISSITDSFSA